MADEQKSDFLANLKNDPFFTGYPAGFDTQTPEFQMAWLRRKIPEVKKQLAAIEAEHVRTGREADEHEHKLRQAEAERKQWEQEKKKKGVLGEFAQFFGIKPAPKGPGLFDIFSGMGHGMTAHISSIQLEVHQNYLFELEAKLESLEHRRTPAVAPDPEEPRRKKKMQGEAKIARLKNEMKQKITDAETPEEAQRWKNIYEDEVRRTEQELKKYL